MASGERDRLRGRGLRILGRTTLPSGEDWWQASGDVTGTKEYREFACECAEIRARYGLARWTVEMACLLKRHKRDKQPLVMEANWPVIDVVVTHDDCPFVQWLCYKAVCVASEERLLLPWRIALKTREGGETILAGPFFEPGQALEKANNPSLAHTFSISVQMPVECPPEFAADSTRIAINFGKELARHLGYSVPKRIRSPVTMKDLRMLRLNKTPLARRDAFEVVVGSYPDEAPSLELDQKRRSRVKAGRPRKRKRLDNRGHWGDQRRPTLMGQMPVPGARALTGGYGPLSVSAQAPRSGGSSRGTRPDSWVRLASQIGHRIPGRSRSDLPSFTGVPSVHRPRPFPVFVRRNR